MTANDIVWILLRKINPGVNKIIQIGGDHKEMAIWNEKSEDYREEF